MMAHILSRLEKSPGAVFYEQELRAIDEAEFDALRAAGLFSGERLLGPGDTFDYKTGARLLTILQGPKGEPEAVDLDDSDFPPLSLSDAMRRQWRFNFDGAAKRLQDANGLAGTAVRLSDRMYFLGEATSQGQRTAYVFALVDGSESARSLRELPGLLPSFPRYVVVTAFQPDPLEEDSLSALGITLSHTDASDPFLFRRGDSVPDRARSTVRDVPGIFWPNEEYTSVVYRGRPFTFSPAQACAVKFLDEMRSKGPPAVGHGRIISHLHQHRFSTHRLRDLFASSEAWETLVVSPRRGLYQLAD